MAEDLQPALIQLTGAGRGARHPLGTDEVTLDATPEGEVRVTRGGAPGTAGRHAEFRRGKEGWRLQAAPGASLYLNGDPVASDRLLPGDVIQIGPDGPILRFRLEPGSGSEYKSLRDAFADCVACARYGSDSLPEGVGMFLEAMPRELLTQTSPWLRAAMVTGIVLGLAAAGYQIFQGRQLADRLETAQVRIDAVRASLRAEQERRIVTPAALDSVSRAMEARGGRSEREVPDVLAGAARSVMLIQGTFGFEDPESGRALHARDGWTGTPSDGSPPRVTVDADGPRLERQYSGTAFAVTSQGHFLTNRHLVRPWRQDPVSRSLAEAGFQPVLRSLTGYLPGRKEPVELELLLESDSADLALLRAKEMEDPPSPLPIANDEARVGQTVYLLGYPTGLRALLVRGPPEVVDALRRDSAARRSPRRITERLAAEGAISPLTTRGGVGQITRSSVVYDAATSQGGSGGPVLSPEGRVVAVNKGIMPDFGGSNFGVPVRHVHRLLEVAGVER